MIDTKEIQKYKNSSFFPVEEKNVLYRADWYILAFALEKKEEDKMSLGLRWQPKNNIEDDIGFPNSFGHPNWMVIPDEMALPILCSLLSTGKHNENDYINEEEIIKAITKIKNLD